jgi:hypothetical protein
MPKTKPYSGTVERRLAIELLNSSGQRTEEGVLLGDALVKTAEQMAVLAEQANKYLADSEFAEIVADHLARKLNKRGHAEISVTSEGRVRLNVTYASKPKRRKTRQRRVPLLADLRTRAKELNVDISKFGTKRKAIHEYLQAVESGEAIKTPQKPQKPVEEPDQGPMSAGPDETRVSPAPAQKPPKRGFIKTGEPVTPVVVNAGGAQKKGLRQLVAEAKDIDIASLIESEEG